MRERKGDYQVAGRIAACIMHIPSRRYAERERARAPPPPRELGSDKGPPRRCARGSFTVRGPPRYCDATAVKPLFLVPSVCVIVFFFLIGSDAFFGGRGKSVLGVLRGDSGG